MASKTPTRPDELARVIPLTDGRELRLTRPLVMGVLNVTPDSFSDGGHFVDGEAAVDHALRLAREGADIIDIGGESSRPGAEPVSGSEEKRRVVPVIEMLRRRTDAAISVDTYKAETARSAIDVGADIINDISALRFDAGMVELVATRRVPTILMHMQGTPRSMQDSPYYDDCVEEIARFFQDRIEFCTQQGIERTRLILDPGIGFGKRLSDNIDILRGLRRFKQFSLPVLVGPSRKSFIGMLHPVGTAADRRLGGSIAAAVTAVLNGADIVRVHDVAETVEALKVIEAVRRMA
ncbi:MAG TPA: dihydropteroate synthase [Candidatus Deferrimicrobium sp.]|nr:dihydropteroate synthase [Candidatus Deferrimicrobium sp.]